MAPRASKSTQDCGHSLVHESMFIKRRWSRAKNCPMVMLVGRSDPASIMVLRHIEGMGSGRHGV